MKIYLVGEKSRAICATCGLVNTTFAYRDVTLRESGRTVKDILVGVCDICGATVSTPAQSTPKIKQERDKATESIEAKIPAPYIDILDIACRKIDPLASQEMKKRLVLFYVHKYATREFDQDKISLAYENLFKLIPNEEDFPKKRFSIKVSERMFNEIDLVAKSLKKSKTEILKYIMAEIKEDVVENDKHLDELRTISAIASC